MTLSAALCYYTSAHSDVVSSLFQIVGFSGIVGISWICSWLSFKLGMDVVLHSEIITVLSKVWFFPVPLQTLNRRHELTWAGDLCFERFVLMFSCEQLLYSGWSFILISSNFINTELNFHQHLSFHTRAVCALFPSYDLTLRLSCMRTRRCRGSTRYRDSDTARINELPLLSMCKHS